MIDSIEVTSGIVSTPEHSNTKTAACAVSLGVSIINELVGTAIGSDVPVDEMREHTTELMAASITTHLNVKGA